MATTDDITRHLFRPEHHYTGVRMQQRRPLLDSDVNEGELLDDEGQRVAAVEVIGPHGSADQGFSISTVDSDPYDFWIHAGSYWLGGLRFEIDNLVDFGDPDGTRIVVPQRFRKQLDWLQQDRTGSVLPTRPADSRHDLVYLLGWEQSVTAVEDTELLEPALGGPDTSSRIRRMHRVGVHIGSSDPIDCGDAFQNFLDLHLGNHHSFDPENHEILSGARLTVTPKNTPDGHLCKPTLHRGYAGPEPQAIRIQCIAHDQFLWSWDDAAPLYRVQLSLDADPTEITLLTLPRDIAHHPAVGQVIEILPWGAQLPNGEKVAEHLIGLGVTGGAYVRVVRSYDSATRTLGVFTSDTTKLRAMQDWLNTRTDETTYFYARVWNPGDYPQTDEVIGTKFGANVPLELAGTGLKISFSAAPIPGDYWIIAARPSDSTRVVPWNLLDGAPPNGPRRFACPLATISWGNVVGVVPSPVVHSCRRTFHPLTQQSGCCTATVGDGSTSFGDYKTINDALRNLPTDRPIKICVLPGVYSERIVLNNRTDLCIEGCGPRTVLTTPPGNNTSRGLVWINECTRVTIRDLRIEATGQFGVMIFQQTSGPIINSTDLTLENLEIHTTRDTTDPEPDIDHLWIPETSAPMPMANIAAFMAEDLKIRGCTLTMGPGSSAAPCIHLVYASDVTVEDCSIIASQAAWGGVYVGLKSEDIVLERNNIKYGRGHGVTLGGITLGAVLLPDYVDVFDPVGRLVLKLGTSQVGVCGDLPENAIPSGGVGSLSVNIGEPIERVQILDNVITLMGGCGVGVLGFRPYSESSPGAYEMFETHDVEIADNRILTNCNSQYDSPPGPGYLDVVGFGGISLAFADNLRIHDNFIAGHASPVARATCGVYLLLGENVVVENNQILLNGVDISGQLAGIRAGIALQLVGRYVWSSELLLNVNGADKMLPAARIRGNVVHQTVGRALQMYGYGPMIVSGNVLASHRLGFTPGEFDAHCVEILNIGQSSELIESESVPVGVDFPDTPPILHNPETDVEPLIVDGRILFTDNQVRWAPPTVLATDVFYCATRLQSYGDVGVFDNQFFTVFPGSVGKLLNDTIVTAWSTRTTGNRWEDPAELIDTEIYQTVNSAKTHAAFNITTLNQATRCITATAPAPYASGSNPIATNQTYLCAD